MRIIVRRCLMITAVLLVFLCACSAPKDNEPAEGGKIILRLKKDRCAEKRLQHASLKKGTGNIFSAMVP